MSPWHEALTAEPASWAERSPGFWTACWNPCCRHPWEVQDGCWSNAVNTVKRNRIRTGTEQCILANNGFYFSFPCPTYSLSSSNVLTENRGEVGSLCWTSTWFLFFTRERRMSLFRRDCSARSTRSAFFSHPPCSRSMFPAQVHTTRAH